MKSRTSFSKLTTFKKDLTRFAPVWGLYLIGMLLVLISDTGYDYDRYANHYMPDLIESFGVVNLIYAAVCAVMLFGDLYNTRMCYSLHTIPQKRETLFLGHMAAALLFSLVPNAVASLYLMIRLESYWFIALYWLLAVTLQFVFFFGVAALSAMLTANRFAMLLVYAGINFVALLVYWVLNTIYLPFMPGVVLNYEIFSLLTPVVKLFGWDYLTFQSIEVPDSDWLGTTKIFYDYTGLGTGWGYTAILAVIGTAAAGLALLLYKLRHLECAGDFVAFPKLKNAACVIMTVCVASICALVSGEVLGDGGLVLWLAVGLVVGFFGSLMLLERRVKVFRKKTFLGFGILTAVLVVSFLVVVFDVLGIVHWVPKASQVESVILSNYYTNNNNYDYGEDYYGSRLSVKLTEKEDIEEILTAHQDIVDRLNSADDDALLSSRNETHQVVLTYTLADGRTVIRSYNAPADGLNYDIVSKYFYTPQQIMGYTDWDAYTENVVHIMVGGNDVPEDMRGKLLNALKTDCDAGFITPYFRGNDRLYWLTIEVRNPNGSYTYRELTIQPGAENSIALLKSPEFLLGSADMEDLLEQISHMTVDGLTIPQASWSYLLEAMQKDCENGDLQMDVYTNGTIYYVEYVTPELSRYFPITEDAENTFAWIQKFHKTPK